MHFVSFFFVHLVCPVPKTATFDASAQNYVNMKSDDFDWTRQRGSTTSTATGPSSDHTSGTGLYSVYSVDVYVLYKSSDNA